MSDLTRRSALSAALLAGGVAAVSGSEVSSDETSLSDGAQETPGPPNSNQAFVIAAGLTKEEAECWTKMAEAAGAFFKLPELHPIDRQEVASAIHIVQNKLLGRPTYRKYLELAKKARAGGE
ncbi:MAG: hypothetical protein AAFU85_19860 [Planctomycetota bacterium]